VLGPALRLACVVLRFKPESDSGSKSDCYPQPEEAQVHSQRCHTLTGMYTPWKRFSARGRIKL
jgi:hypothetical protein